jgi:hypothetical protein
LNFRVTTLISAALLPADALQRTNIRVSDNGDRPSALTDLLQRVSSGRIFTRLFCPGLHQPPALCPQQGGYSFPSPDLSFSLEKLSRIVSNGMYHVNEIQENLLKFVTKLAVL